MNSTEKPPDACVFFLDRNLGTKQVAEALCRAGAVVEIHNDHFLPDANDEEWLPEVGKRGWIVLTKEDRIRYRTPERTALMKAWVAMFALASGNLRGEEMAQAFVKALPVYIDSWQNIIHPLLPKSREMEQSLWRSGARSCRVGYCLLFRFDAFELQEPFPEPFPFHWGECPVAEVGKCRLIGENRASSAVENALIGDADGVEIARLFRAPVVEEGEQRVYWSMFSGSLLTRSEP